MAGQAWSGVEACKPVAGQAWSGKKKSTLFIYFNFINYLLQSGFYRILISYFASQRGNNGKSSFCIKVSS